MINDLDLKHLREAIDVSRLAKTRGNAPYGATLVSAEGDTLLIAENTQVTTSDPTAHAETNLVRKTHGIDKAMLKSATLYASGEPCPMCAGAIFNAGIGRLVFALSQSRILSLSEDKSRIPISAATLLTEAIPPIAVEGPALEDEAEAVLTS